MSMIKPKHSAKIGDWNINALKENNITKNWFVFIAVLSTIDSSKKKSAPDAGADFIL